MSQILENGATSGAGILVAYSYNNLGQRTGVTRVGGAGATTSYGYDGAWRLNSRAQGFATSANLCQFRRHSTGSSIATIHRLSAYPPML